MANQFDCFKERKDGGGVGHVEKVHPEGASQRSSTYKQNKHIIQDIRPINMLHYTPSGQPSRNGARTEVPMPRFTPGLDRGAGSGVLCGELYALYAPLPTISLSALKPEAVETFASDRRTTDTLGSPSIASTDFTVCSKMAKKCILGTQI